MRTRQRGVALLVVLLILALMVTISATIAERSGRAYLRTVGQLERQQARWYALAAESLAGKVLRLDGRDSPNKTHLAQYWAQEGRQFPVEGGQVAGQIQDGQACFNLNAINQDAGEQDAEPKAPYPARVFRQLLQNLGEEPLRAAQVTAALRDWVDSDRIPLADGAEDEAYAALDSPYLPANQPLADVSELRAVLGVDADLYRRLLPYVCALPTQTLQMNVNTLRESQGPLLAALFLTGLGATEADQLLLQRPREGWNSVAAFLAQESLREMNHQAVRQVLTVKSDLFFASFSVRMGDMEYSQRSLLQRDGNNIHVLQRQYGLSMAVVP